MRAETTVTGDCQEWEYERSTPGGVVVGVDMSLPSVAALETAADIARRQRLALHAVVVIPEFPAYHLPPGSDRGRKALDELRVLLKESEAHDLIRHLDENPPERFTQEVVIGDAVEQLLEIAHDRCAELLVIGRHRHGVIDRALGFETMSRIMGSTTVPVLAVDTPMLRAHIAVAAIDFSASSVAAARAASTLLTPPAILHLAYVDHSGLLDSTDPLPHSTGDFRGDPVSAFRSIESCIPQGDGIALNRRVLEGHPAEAVIKFARETKADFISAGSHGRHALERALTGSVSRQLVRKSPCPVLVVKAR